MQALVHNETLTTLVLSSAVQTADEMKRLAEGQSITHL